MHWCSRKPRELSIKCCKYSLCEKSVSLTAFVFQPVNCSLVCLLSKCSSDIKTIFWNETIEQFGERRKNRGNNISGRNIGCGRVKWWLDSILFYRESFQLRMWLQKLAFAFSSKDYLDSSIFRALPVFSEREHLERITVQVSRTCSHPNSTSPVIHQ